MESPNAGPSSAGPSMLVSAYPPVIHADPHHPHQQSSHPSQPPLPLAPRPYPDGTAPVFRACASSMQVPTLTRVRIRSTRDALQIFYAVARGALPMTSRRLDAEERRAIVPGNVYIWEERCANSEATGMGMERWCAPVRKSLGLISG